MQEPRRLSRDRDHRMIGGVCSGIALRYGYDVTVVRIVFVVAGLMSGLGVLAYLVMWLLLPADERIETPTRQVMRDNVEEMAERARLAAESARAAAEAARQAADQLAEATRAAARAARDTWQQGAQQGASQEASPQQGEPAPGSEASETPPEPSGTPGETAPEGSPSSWPPDRPLPETEAPVEETAASATSEGQPEQPAEQREGAPGNP